MALAGWEVSLIADDGSTFCTTLETLLLEQASSIRLSTPSKLLKTNHPIPSLLGGWGILH